MRGNRWAEPRLDDGDFRAVLFADFRVDEDGISTWADPAELAAQVTASTLEEVKTIHLLEIPEEVLKDIAIPVVESPGKAPDAASAHLHRNLECFGGTRLMLLVDRLTDAPSCKRFSTAEVRQLLAERVGVGLTLEQLEPRVIEDLMVNNHVGEDEGFRALQVHFDRNPLVLRKLKLKTVQALVRNGSVPAGSAQVIHAGYQAT